jgi:hypothetical protein
LIGFELLEEEIEGHDLGQGSGVARLVGLDLVQNLAGFVVDHDRRIRRLIVGPVYDPRMLLLSLLLAVSACLCAVSTGNCQRGQQTENNNTMQG